jgi:hypothetical protein
MAYDRSKTVGRVAFLAHLDAIRDLLEKGHRNKEVFAELEAKLTISYSQFNRYVVRYIVEANSDGHQKKSIAESPPVFHSPKPASNTAQQAKDSATKAESSTHKRPIFKHDPNSGNERDDLI